MIAKDYIVTPGKGWADVAENLMSAAISLAHEQNLRPLPQGRPEEVLAHAKEMLGPCEIPDAGIGTDDALNRLGSLLYQYGVNLSHEKVAAHLQPPTLKVAVAADALASSTNASLDTYDSGAGAIAVENWVLGVLGQLAGFNHQSGGVFTPGGSLSNLSALMIARDRAAASRCGVDVRNEGVAAIPDPKIFTSELAHFSMHRACSALGLGERAVVAIPSDRANRMRPEVLDRELSKLDKTSTPIAVVATAGTTDFGSIDPLNEIADVAERHGVWLHVDAAYGFGAMFSSKLAHLLSGLHRADSITLDMHKIGWQPAAASVLLLANAGDFSSFSRSVPYLNPLDDEEAGFGGLLGYTLQTTRRPDAVKVAASLLAFGRSGLGSMLDNCHALAKCAEARVMAEPALELVAEVTMTTVVFRYRCADADYVNSELRRRMLIEGEAIIGRTEVSLAEGEAGKVCLKLTFLNPQATEAGVHEIFDQILATADRIQRS